MASAVGATSLRSLCDAWLAHMSLVDRDIDGVILHAKAVLAQRKPDDYAASFRVATAMASAWSLAVGEATARPWWWWTRQQAVAEGDDADLSALIYNQAQMRAVHIRHAAFAGAVDAMPAALLGVDSIGNYDGAVGGSARSDLTPLMRAQLLTVDGEFTSAAALFEAHLPQAVAAGLARVGGSLLADLAWCWANTGQGQRARALADQAAVEVLAEDSPHCDLDERAALHARLAQVYARFHEEGLAAHHADAAAEVWAQHAAQRRDWAERMKTAGLLSPPRA
jgi:hypothetical protein